MNLIDFIPLIKGKFGYFREDRQKWFDGATLVLAFILSAVVISQEDYIRNDLYERLRSIHDVISSLYPEVFSRATVFFFLTFLIFLLILEVGNFLTRKLRTRGSKDRADLFHRKSWLVEGNAYISDSDISIRDSWAGILLKNPLYRNCEISFDFLAHSPQTEVTIGIIFRAQDFDSYFMCQIKLTGKEITIRPHVRLGEIFTPSNNNANPYTGEATGKHSIKLRIENDKVTADFDNLRFPTYTLPDAAQFTLKASEQDKTNPLEKPVSVKKIPFKNKFGRIGFRAVGNEGGTISNLSIRSLD